MGDARRTMDRISQAVTAGDREALRRLYADDAVGDTPDEGRLTGADAIVDWMMSFNEAFPDTTFEPLSQLEAGDTAVDEAVLVGTHTGPLRLPDGELPPTGRAIRVRECDIVQVRDGKVVSHRFYFDQLELMAQLELVDQTIVLPDAGRPSAASGVSPRRP